jgi:NAD(P)-dependent dehydrogenase (short-subunit alcohol dehydrogenase family)
MQTVLKRLEGRNALITGGGHGIGRGCALRLAEEGANVAIIDLDADAANGLQREISVRGTSAFVASGDCCSADVASDFVAKAEREIGPIDILINNVGQSARERQGPFLTSEESTWRFVMEVNLFTTMRFSRLLAPGMSERKYGRIINMSSESAFVGGAGSHDYAAAKMAIIGFTRSLARQLAEYNITVNAICPGVTRTRAIEKAVAEGHRDVVDRAKAEVLLDRIGEPEDVASMAALLASEEGRFITGQSILVNGGRWMV